MAVNIISEQGSLNWLILTSKFQPTCYVPDFSAHPYSISYPVILLLLWWIDQRQWQLWTCKWNQLWCLHISLQPLIAWATEHMQSNKSQNCLLGGAIESTCKLNKCIHPKIEDFLLIKNG